MAGESSGEVLYVYPTGLKVEDIVSRLALRLECLFDYRIITFPELTDILSREAGAGSATLPESLAAVVVASLLDREVGGLKRAVTFPPGTGFARSILGVIKEFEGAYMAPDDINELTTQMPAGEPAERLAMLGQIYRDYRAVLARLGWTDRHDREWRLFSFLQDQISQGKRPLYLRGVRKIVFAEIYDFSVTQFLIATSLISLIGDAELVIQAEGVSVDAMGFCQRTWNRFVEDESIADIVLPEFVNRSGREGNLAALLQGLFHPPPGSPQPPDGSVRLLVAQSRYYEAEEVGRGVRRLLEQGVPPDEIAVLARDLSVYGDLIEGVFRRYGIPAYFRRGRPLAATGIIKHLVNIVKLPAEGFPCLRLATLMKSPYLATELAEHAWVLSRLGYIDSETTPLDSCLKRALAGASDMDKAANQAPPGAAAASDRLEAAAGRVRELLGQLAALDKPRSLREHIMALRALLDDLGVRVVSSANWSASSDRRDSLAYARWCELLGQLEAIGEGLAAGPVDFSTFAGLLLAALEVEQLEEPTLAETGVRILSVEDARGLEFDTVFILGLDDGTFPAVEGDNPLLPDRHRVEINRWAAQVLRRKLGKASAGMPLGIVFRTSNETGRRDPFLFFLAVGMARQRLFLCYPVTNEKGNPTVRSPFLDEVASLVELTAGEGEVRPAGRVVPVLDDCFELAELLNRGATDSMSGADNPLWIRLAEKLGPECLHDITRRSRIERARAAFFLANPSGARKDALAGPHVGRLGEAGEDLRRMLSQRYWSTAALDDLGACPFKFFAAHVLGIPERTEGGVELDRRQRGEIIHRLLKLFIERYPALPPGLEEAAEKMRQCVAQEKASCRREEVPVLEAFSGLAWEEIEEALLDLLPHELSEQARLRGGGEVRRLLERSFSLVIEDHRDVPPDERVKIKIRGRIDRVDIIMDPERGKITRLRVVDYKHSRNLEYRKRLDPYKLLGVVAFQIPVYLMSLMQDSSLPGELAPETVLEGAYYLLRAESKIQVRELPQELFILDARQRASVQGVDPVANRLVAMFASALKGHFDVSPVECDDWCPYRMLCRYVPSAAAGAGEGE